MPSSNVLKGGCYKIKQTKDRKLVEQALFELTIQCPPFLNQTFKLLQKSPESLLLRKSSSTPELPSVQPPTPKRPVNSFSSLTKT